MWEERNDLKMELSCKTEAELTEWTHSQTTHIAKIEKVCSGGSTKGVVKHLFDKEIGVCAHHGFHQQPWQESYQFELRRKEIGRMKEDRMAGLLEFYRMKP